MKKRFLTATSLFLVASILLSSCASTTLIQSTPSEARLYLNDELAGTTPYRMRDKKIAGSCTKVRLEKEGFDSFSTEICRNEKVDAGAIVGGLFFLVPYFWIMKYKPTHTYEMKTSLSDEELTKLYPNRVKEAQITDAEKLQQLRKQYEAGTLTKEEYEKEKKKIYQKF